MHEVISEHALDCGDLLQAAVESLSQFAWMCDAKGNCFYANRSFVDFSRAVLGDKARLNWLDLVSRDEEANVVEHWMASTPKAAELAQELRMRTRGGEVRWFDVKVVPVLDQDSSVRYWFGMAYDVTARKRLDASTLPSQISFDAAVTQSVANLTISAMAHDLNQPLAAAGTYASVAMRLLRNKVTDRDTFEHALEQIIAEIRRAGRMFKEFTDVSTLDKPQLEPFDLALWTGEAVAKLKNDDIDKAMRVSVTTKGNLEPVLANKVWLEKSLHALVRSREPTTPDQETAPREVVITTAPSADGTHGQITVQHYRPRLDDETIRTLFKPLYGSKSGVLGLTLAVHRALIEAQGGEFWTEPSRHEGPAYCLALPFTSCAPA